MSTNDNFNNIKPTLGPDWTYRPLPTTPLPISLPSKQPQGMTSEEITRRLLETIQTHESTKRVSNVVRLERKIDAILMFLAMSPTERGFVQYLCDNPKCPVTLAAFADWLKEQGREEEAEAIEKVV